MEQATKTAVVPFHSEVALPSTLFYMGNLMSFLARGEATNGRFALMEMQAKPGNEPPPHVHEWEHELYLLQDGEIDFYIGDQTFPAKPGEVVLIPRGAPHAFITRTPTVRTLMLVVAAGAHDVGLDTYFAEMGQPATSMRLPTGATTYADVDMGKAISFGTETGTTFLSPEDTARLLPTYPGFEVTSPAH